MNKRHVIRWSAVIICMLVIFGFSAQNKEESNKTSKTISKAVKVVVENLTPQSTEKVDIDEVDDKVRSMAHFLMFTLLGLSVAWAMNLNFEGLSLLFLSSIICVLYALLDETHQNFVPGRAFQWSDIAVDSLGAILSVCLYFIFRKKNVA